MKPSRLIVRELAEEACNGIVRKTISNLQKIEAGLVVGDSGLKNVWDEICVQMQSEESFYWFAYKYQIESTVFWYLGALKP